MTSPVTQVTERYEEFLAKPFPAGYRMKTVGNKTLAVYQSEMLGFIITYANTNGSLGSRQRKVLNDDAQQLQKALSEFSEEAQVYFKELLSLVQYVLRTAHDQPK